MNFTGASKNEIPRTMPSQISAMHAADRSNKAFLFFGDSILRDTHLSSKFFNYTKVNRFRVQSSGLKNLNQLLSRDSALMC
jgi:hypothetical protein